MNILPGLVVAGIGLLSMKYPRPAGILIFAASIFLLWKILGAKGFDWGSVAAAVIVCVPLMIGGVFLIRVRNAKIEMESDGIES
jgi:hypothetical protein